jgi:hypothetical protein
MTTSRFNDFPDSPAELLIDHDEQLVEQLERLLPQLLAGGRMRSAAIIYDWPEGNHQKPTGCAVDQAGPLRPQDQEAVLGLSRQVEKLRLHLDALRQAGYEQARRELREVLQQLAVARKQLGLLQEQIDGQGEATAGTGKETD